MLSLSKLIHRLANARKPLRIVIVADEQPALPDLWPPSGDVGFGRFVAVLGVDEDEVELSVVETAWTQVDSNEESRRKMDQLNLLGEGDGRSATDEEQ